MVALPGHFTVTPQAIGKGVTGVAGQGIDQPGGEATIRLQSVAPFKQHLLSQDLLIGEHPAQVLGDQVAACLFRCQAQTDEQDTRKRRDQKSCAEQLTWREAPGNGEGEENDRCQEAQ